MLGPGRYLLGVTEILLVAGFAWLGATRARAWLLPALRGAPAHLATVVLAAAFLIWPAELLGSFGWLTLAPYLVLVLALGAGSWTLLARVARGGGLRPRLPRTKTPTPGQDPRAETPPALRPGSTASERRDHTATHPLVTFIALLIATAAVVHFALGVKSRLSTGMTGFDSTWYHGPFAAGFFQSGDTWTLHFIAPQFLAWFYPANAEVLHAIGMLAFGRDLLSPLLNLGWFLGCLLACWCIGRSNGVAPWSLALGAVALSVPAFADQAGEARNDLVATFFLLAGVAVAINSEEKGGEEPAPHVGAVSGGKTAPRPGVGSLGPYVVVGLAAGLAAGTKLNFLLPAAVLVVGLALVGPAGGRLRSLLAGAVAALAGGGYWYLRNLVHSGNPLPWIHHLGPVDLPAPQQALGGREGHSVAAYLTDGGVWSEWLLPGLHGGLWIVWPLLLLAGGAGLVLSLAGLRPRRADLSVSFKPRADVPEPVGQIGPSSRVPGVGRGVAGAVGVASIVAWAVAPTSASGPDGMPRGFESGLRYLVPALVLGLALLPAAEPLRRRLLGLPGWRPRFSFPWSRNLGLPGWRPRLSFPWSRNLDRVGPGGMRGWLVGAVAIVLAAVAVGYPIQRHYLRGRYADPSFAAPGLDAAFAWARNVSDSEIATTSTRQYPLYGTDLANHVQYLGIERPHGGFEAPATCRAYRRLLDASHYDYVVASRDRLEPGKPPYPPQAKWTEAPQSQVILRKPPTVVFRLRAPLDPAACPASRPAPASSKP